MNQNFHFEKVATLEEELFTTLSVFNTQAFINIRNIYFYNGESFEQLYFIDTKTVSGFENDGSISANLRYTLPILSIFIYGNLKLSNGKSI